MRNAASERTKRCDGDLINQSVVRLKRDIDRASAVCLCLHCPGRDALSLTARADTSSAANGKRRAGVTIQVDNQGWGAVDTRQIERVLHSVADLLLSDLPERSPITVRVSHTETNPVALYERGPEGEYLIRLHADRTRWHLYVYEFAHEFCHILSNFDRAGGEVSRQNQWFEETICETASLYALGSLATEWSLSPPEPSLANHANELRRFFRFLITEGHRKLPEDTELREWLKEHEAQLCADPYRRDQNETIWWPRRYFPCSLPIHGGGRPSPI